MGLKIFCLNLSHWLDLFPVLPCVCVCVKEQVCVCVCVCVTGVNAGFCVCGRAHVGISETVLIDSLG